MGLRSTGPGRHHRDVISSRRQDGHREVGVHWPKARGRLKQQMPTAVGMKVKPQDSGNCPTATTTALVHCSLGRAKGTQIHFNKLQKSRNMLYCPLEQHLAHNRYSNTNYPSVLHFAYTGVRVSQVQATGTHLYRQEGNIRAERQLINHLVQTP